MNSTVIATILFLSTIVGSSRLPLEVFQYHPLKHHLHHRAHHAYSLGHRKKITNLTTFKIVYQVGKTDEDLPVCSPKVVCSTVDLYDTPWMEKQCRCPNGRTCPSILASDDGHTLTDKTRLYKMCEPVKKLPKCRYFRDVTWSLRLNHNNITEQIVHCHCPKNSVTYFIKRQAFHGLDETAKYQYSFACSPQSRLRCERKEPCRLFTVRKRQEYMDEVNINTLCQCPHAHRCPRHHTEYGTIAGKSYSEESIRTYSGYCIPNGNMT